MDQSLRGRRLGAGCYSRCGTRRGDGGTSGLGYLGSLSPAVRLVQECYIGILLSIKTYSYDDSVTYTSVKVEHRGSERTKRGLSMLHSFP